jgi:hypothetical protein
VSAGIALLAKTHEVNLAVIRITDLGDRPSAT